MLVPLFVRHVVPLLLLRVLLLVSLYVLALVSSLSLSTSLPSSRLTLALGPLYLLTLVLSTMAVLWRGQLARLVALAVRGAEALMRVLGVVLIVFGGTLIGGCVFFYYYFLLPYHYPQWSLGSAVHLAISIWLLLNIAFHYTMACASSAGNPPRNDAENADEAREKYPPNVRFCKHCTRVCEHFPCPALPSPR